MENSLNDLVEFPRETLEVELNEWLDPDQKSVRARIARHLAALTNHGGGHVVLGVGD